MGWSWNNTLVNAARTLLMNLAYTELVERYGDQLVPGNYAPVHEHQDTAAVKRVLFGANPDKLTINYRLAQYMRLLHSDPVARQHTLALGDRVTYLDSDFFFDLEPSVTSRVIEADSIGMSAVGVPSGDPVSGQNLRSFSVELVADTSRAVIRYTQRSGGIRSVPKGGRIFALNEEQLVPFTPPDDPNVTLSFPLLELNVDSELDGTGWIEATNNTSHWSHEWLNEVNPSYNPVFLLTLTSKPTPSLADIATKVVDDMQAGSLGYGLPTIGEPYATFRSMAAPGPHVMRRLCGVLLLLIYSNSQINSARAA